MQREEQRARGFSLGACEYLVKPVEPERLVEVVQRSLGQHAGSTVTTAPPSQVGSTHPMRPTLGRHGAVVDELNDLRETLERHAEGLEDTRRHDRATAVRRRARAVRR